MKLIYFNSMLFHKKPDHNEYHQKLADAKSSAGLAAQQEVR